MKIGFIGCGNMGSAMIGGILKNGVFEKNEIIVSNLTEEGSRRSREKLGVVTTLDNCEVVKNANIVILAVKPQFYEEVIGEIKKTSRRNPRDDKIRCSLCILLLFCSIPASWATVSWFALNPLIYAGLKHLK